MFEQLPVRYSGTHGDPPDSFWTAWPNEPLMQVLFVASCLVLWIGWGRLKETSPSAFPSWRGWSLTAGMASLGIALLSPVAVYSDFLFTMHMVQHLLLLTVTPPLLLQGKPLVPFLHGLPKRVRQPIARNLAPGRWMHKVGYVLGNPAVAMAAYLITVAVWHIPVMYDAAQGRTITHDLEHFMFLGTATLFWWPVIHPTGGRRRLSLGKAIPYLLPPLLEAMLIGIVLTFAQSPLYTTYQDVAPTWGLSVLDDQQLGGLIMWVPGGLLFLIPLIGLLAAFLNKEEREMTARQRAQTGG